MYANDISKRRRVSSARGITLVELLVVLAILAVLSAISLSAVQSARESARRTICQDHLREIGLAVELHRNSQRHYPTNGWGFRWVGDARRGYGGEQPGGWAYNILEYCELSNVHDMAAGESLLEQKASGGVMIQTPLELFCCPSRRGVTGYPYTEGVFLLANADVPALAGKTDYAINAGDTEIMGVPGPSSYAPSDVGSYVWPTGEFNGLSFVRSRVRSSDVTDGLSNTLLVGEKALVPARYTDGNTLGDDQSLYVGDDADIRRWGTGAPIPDRSGIESFVHFGGPHFAGCQFVVADGSVRSIPFSVDRQVFANLSNRCDGEVIPEW